MTSSSPKPRKPTSASLQIGLTPEQKERNRKADEARARVRQQRGSAGSGAGGSRSGGRSPGAVTTAPRATPPRTGGRGGATPPPRTQASATPPAAVQRSNPARQQGNLLNDIQYELGNPNSQTRRLGAKILDEAAEALYPRKQVIGAIGSVREAEQQKGGGLTPVETIDAAMKGGRSYLGQQLGAGLTTNVANLSRWAYSNARVLAGQSDDATAGPVGSFIDSAEEGVYRGMGMKPPSQMTQDELGRHELRSDLTGALLTYALTVATGGAAAPILSGARALQATTSMGRIGYGGIALAGQELINSVFSNPTGGNFSNAVNYYAGADIAPFAVDPGKDGWAASYWKGLAPNIVGGELLGAGLGLGANIAVSGGRFAGRTLRDLGVPMGNTKGAARRARGAAQEASERERQVADGLLQQDPESGAHGFTPEAMGQQPSPAPDAPEPTTPRTEMAPEADPAFNPWTDFDPGLPTSTALGKALDDLTDEQLGLLRDNEGASVPEGVEDLLAAQERAPAMPPMPAQVLDASLLPEDYVASLGNKFRGFADGDKAFDPRPLFDPDTNPEIWKRAEALTGKSDPAELTPTDMADTLEGMLADGQAVIPSRQGAELMDVANIRRPVSDAAPVEDAAADPWSQPNNALPDQTRWDPRQEGTIQIQDNPDGTVSVVDGAQRLGLAERLGVRQVPVTREAPAPDAPAPDALEAPARIELTPEERAQIKRDLLMRAAQAGEIRPPDAPVPAFSDPALQNLGKVDLDKPIEPGSAEAQALADEARIAVEAMREQNEFAQGMKEAQRDADGYEKLTWAEKMAKGITGGWEAPPPARAAAPAPGVPEAPVKPVQVKLSSGGDQPPFTLPPGLAGAKPRYGSKQIRFASDLDKVAYMLLADRTKGASKSAAAYRQALEEAGLDMGSVVNHGLAVKKALKASRPAGDGVIDLPQQPWGGDEGFLSRRLSSIAIETVPSADRPTAAAGGIFAKEQYTPVSPQEAAIRAKVVEEIVRRVAGKHVTLRLADVYESGLIPPEHGGDGIATGLGQGWYRAFDDTILVGGIMDARVPMSSLIKAAYHESFHRLQHLGFGLQEMKTLDSSLVRFQTWLNEQHKQATPLGETIRRHSGRAYIESGPSDFMRYAGKVHANKIFDGNSPLFRNGKKVTMGDLFIEYADAVRAGGDPVPVVLGVQKMADIPDQAPRNWAENIISHLYAMYQFVGQLSNGFRGAVLGGRRAGRRTIYDLAIEGKYGDMADARLYEILMDAGRNGRPLSKRGLKEAEVEPWRLKMLKGWKEKKPLEQNAALARAYELGADLRRDVLDQVELVVRKRQQRLELEALRKEIEALKASARKGGCI